MFIYLSIRRGVRRTVVKPQPAVLIAHEALGRITGLPAANRWGVLKMTDGYQTSGDEGFNRFIRHFKPERRVEAQLWVEDGLHGEMGLAISIQQGNFRCLLTDCAHDRFKPDATWEALSVWADFESKAQDTIQFLPEEFAHEFEQAGDHLDILSKLEGFNGLPDYRHKSKRELSLGFANVGGHPPWSQS
jgi:hypothetical protein